MARVRFKLGALYTEDGAESPRELSIYDGPSGSYFIDAPENGFIFVNENQSTSQFFSDENNDPFLESDYAILADFSDNTGVVTLRGGLQGDVLRGGSAADVLSGVEGDDVLEGGVGADRLFGGDGIDTASYVSSTDAVTVNLTTGTGTGGHAEGDILRTIESLIGSARGDSLTGNELSNLLQGRDGDDRLDGGVGADRLVGGLGDDTFVVDDAGDLLYESANAGTDTVESSVGYTLRANIENLILTGSANVNATGNDASNILTGNDRANVLDGRAGADTMRGGAGNDTYRVDAADDVVIEASDGGSDTILSTVSYTLDWAPHVEKLQLLGTAFRAYGSSGNDVLVGNAVDNELAGGLGNDKLTGGLGADTFVFNSAIGRTNVDKITDFTHGVDRIALRGDIFTALTGDALSAEAFKDLGAAGASVDADDRILYDARTGGLSYDADGSGSAKAVVFALLSNKPAINHSDFFVFA